jgi:hypothetical protein
MAVCVVAGVPHKNNFHFMYLLIYRYGQLKRSKDLELFRNFVVIKFGICRIWKKELLWTFTMRVDWCVGLIVGLR